MRKPIESGELPSETDHFGGVSRRSAEKWGHRSQAAPESGTFNLLKKKAAPLTGRPELTLAEADCCRTFPRDTAFGQGPICQIPVPSRKSTLWEIDPHSRFLMLHHKGKHGSPTKKFYLTGWRRHIRKKPAHPCMPELSWWRSTGKFGSFKNKMP